MKKILIFVIVAIFSTFNMNSADAASAIKNYNGYVLVGKTLDFIIPKIDEAIANEKDIKKIQGAPNAYYITYKGAHCYIRFYPANKNSNVYIVADEVYDKNNNDFTLFFKSKGIKYYELTDKEALKEYQFDFIDHARTGALDGLFIMPDCFKPLKIGMQKINDKISKNSKKTSAIAYSNDTDPIDLTCVDTKNYINEEAKITITVKEYRLKNKQNKYVHAYEYIVRNTDITPVKINKVTSERVASMKDVTTQTFVDLDKLDLVDTIATFPPVLICTCGLSIIGSVPNWVRLAKVTKESLRYAHTLPENYELKQNSKMRILVLKFKNDPKPLDFDVTRNDQNYKFSF